eukprot:TCONS_00019388-protein
MAEANTSNHDDISSENQQKLTELQQIVGKDVEECKSLLLKHSWNMEAAVHSVFSEQEGIASVWDNISESAQQRQQQSPSLRPPQSSSSTSTRISRPYHVGRTVQMNNARQSWATWLLNAPYNILHFGLSFAYYSASQFVLFIVRIVWPTFGRTPTDPVEDVTKFKENFEEEYGSTHPTFYLGSYGQVLADAKKELRFLLVYLHAPHHQSTPEFCRNVLSNENFREYTINRRLLFWGCDISTNEGHRVSRAMRETTYPFLAVVCLREGRMTVVWRIEGCLDLDRLIAVCEQVFNDNEAALVAAQAERNERNFSRSLREEQDQDFLKSLEEDKKKSALKKEKEDAIKEVERVKKEKEDERLRKLEELANRRQVCRTKFESLVEPSQGDEGVVKLRIRLSNGENMQRFFMKSDTLQLLYDYVLSNDASPSEFQLRTSFPRNVYPLDETNCERTLESIGIKTSTQFLVEDLTEESSGDEEEDDE